MYQNYPLALNFVPSVINLFTFRQEYLKITSLTPLISRNAHIQVTLSHLIIFLSIFFRVLGYAHKKSSKPRFLR